MATNSYDKIISQAQENASTPIGQLNLQGTFLEKLFMPGQVQEREFGQQVALERLQYEQSIDYARKMEEMKKAGINPNLAASGISQSGSTQAAPNIPSSPDGVTISDLLSPLTGAGDFAKNIGDAVQKLGSFREFKENLRTQSIANLEKAGFDHWSAVSISETLPLLKDNQRADFYLKLSNVRKISQEYQNLKANYDNILAEYDAIIARKDLDISQADYFDALKGKVKAEADFQQSVNEFFSSHNYLPDSPLDVSLRNAVVSGKFEEADSIGAVIESYNDSAKQGEQKAVARNAYDIAYETGRAQFDFDWSAPPKTMFEFISKAAVNMKEKLRSMREKFSSSDKGSADDSTIVDESTLRNSYLEYKSQLSVQYEQLNMLRSDLADKLADGANRVETMELRQEIAKMEVELRKMPSTYNEFKKYVRNQ